MVFTNLIISLILTLLITHRCNARVADYSFLDTQPDWRYADLKERQSSSSCIVLSCNPNDCTGAACYLPGVYQRRAVEFNATELYDESEGTLSLVKRILANPTNIGQYLNNLATRPTANNVVPPNAGGFASPSFCSQMRFSDLPTYQSTVIGMGNTELTGCTVLCVVSARAVYMCHFWEDTHFPHVNTVPGPHPRVNYGIGPVINLISGNGGAIPNAAGPALDPTLFNGGAHDNTVAFIMTPRNRATPNDATSQEHGPEIQQVAATVRQLIPGVQIQIYNYFATGQGYPEEYQGVALWQYDPNADGNGGANWRLWFEASNENGIAMGQQVI